MPWDSIPPHIKESTHPMVPTTIIRTPNARPQHQQAVPSRNRRPISLEERGSLAGTILMVVFSLVLMSWVILGVA